MFFLLAAGRALALMVLLPVAVFAISSLFLPPEFVPLPVVGELSVRHVLAGLTFFIGFLVWAQKPTGREEDDDFTTDTESE